MWGYRDRFDRPRFWRDYPWADAGLRWAAAIGVAIAYGLVCFVVVDLVRPDSGYFSVTFAILQPAVICAFLAWMFDPHFRRGSRYYSFLPVWVSFGMWVISLPILKEGVICVIMLTPIWLASGLAGTKLLEWARKEAGDGDGQERTFAIGLFALPLALLPIEASLPAPAAMHTVSRSIVIDAPAHAIWPLMQGMGDVGANEGRFNFSQSVASLPRPVNATLHGSGIGARRLGRWENGIHFAEIVDRWEPGRRIGWRFDFSDSAGWEFTDRHLHPGSEHMDVTRGGYTLEALGPGRHRLTLFTDYTARTHLNAYAALWGELFLGDVSNNLLAIIKDRAEAG